MLDALADSKMTRTILVLWSGLVLVGFLALSPALRAYSPRSLGVLGLGALTGYAFWFAGFRLRRLLSGRLPEEPTCLGRSAIELGLGVSAFVFVLIAAAALGLLRPHLAWAAIAAALAGRHGAFLSELRERWNALRAAGWEVFPAGVLAASALVSLFWSLTPVIAQDALVYHMALPAQYVRAGGFVPVDGSFFASFPQNVEMLFSMALLLGSEPLAQLFHWMLGVAAAASIGHLSLILNPRGSAWLAAAAFGAIPTVVLVAGGAYVDLGVVLFVVLSISAFLRWHEGGGTAWIVLAAFFAGAAAGCKYTAGLQGLLVAGGVLLVAGVLRREPRRGLALAALAALVVAAVACPWWIKNVAYTGNPLYPFCYSIFGGKGWDAESAEVLSGALGEWGGSRSPLDALVLPWRLTMQGEFLSFEHFDGVIGPAFLIGAPCLVLGLKLSRPYAATALFLAAHFIFWSLTTRQVRFLLPALACASAMLGASVPGLLGAAWGRTALGWALKASLALDLLVSSVGFAAGSPLGVVLGIEKERDFLHRTVPGGDYAVFEYIETKLPEDSYIFFASLGNPGFLCKRRYRADAFIENRTIIRMLRDASDENALLRAFRREGFTHLLFRFENVFDRTGKKSDIPLEQQMKLMGFLNRHARLLAEKAGTLLYEIGDGIGREAASAREAPGASSGPR